MDINKRNLRRAPTLSVVVPCLNEEANVGPTVERLLQALSITVEDSEIIIVNDGSSDRTGEVADDLAGRFPEVKVIHNSHNKGLGAAYLSGIETATKEFIVYIPGDNTWPYRSFIELFGSLGTVDIVTSYSSNPQVRPFGRRILSKSYTRFMNLMFGQRMQYFNGLTIYPIEFMRMNPISTFGFGFQAEALLKALSLGYSFIEVCLPIDERTVGASKAVTLQNILSVMGTVIRLFWALRIRKTWPGDRKKNRPATSWAGTSRVGSTVDEVGFHARQYHADEGQREESQGRPLNIVVTGASSGIGAALAVALARDGHKLFLCARSPDKIRKIGDETGAQVAVCDVSQEDQVAAFRRMVSDHVDAVDVLVNCAGSFGEIGPIELADTGRWLDTLRVNLFGPFLVIKHFLPLLDKSASPRIINLSGGGAFSPFPNYSAYACSKAALVRLTETLAAELAPRGIAVNAVAPGIIQTAIHKATLEAGPERAGPLAFRRTQFIMRQKDSSMENVVACIKRMLSPSLGGLTGKTISANFDAWSTEVFEDHLPEISSSDVFTLRRVNIVNLPNGALRQALSHAWSKHATEI